jgi:signal peptidase II
MKRYLQRSWKLFLIAAVVVLLDQSSKYWIHQNLQLGEIYRPELWLSGFARIIHWKNTGVIFGLLPNLSLLFTVLPFIVSLGILIYFPRIPPQDWLIQLALGLYLGGAIGNLVDRLVYGYVTDFISVGSFPVFNVADSSLSIAAALFLVGLLLQEKRQRAEPDETPDDPQAKHSDASGAPDQTR